MKKINLSIILISTGMATAMNPTAWKQHIKTWHEITYSDLSPRDKDRAKSELTTAKQAITFCTTIGGNNSKAILEAREAIRRTAMVTKKLVAPLLEELEQGNTQNVQMKIAQACASIANPEAKL